jgi:hypothetical protein
VNNGEANRPKIHAPFAQHLANCFFRLPFLPKLRRLAFSQPKSPLPFGYTFAASRQIQKPQKTSLRVVC